MTRLSLALCAVLPLSALAGPQGASPMSADDEALHRMHDEFTAAWSAGDTKRAASFWTEDGVRVGAGGDVQRGRAEIEQALARLLGGPFKGATVRMGHGTICPLTADLALYQGPMQIEPGQGKAPIKGYVIDVMKKVGGHWLMLESHPKLSPRRRPRAADGAFTGPDRETFQVDLPH